MVFKLSAKNVLQRRRLAHLFFFMEFSLRMLQKPNTKPLNEHYGFYHILWKVIVPRKSGKITKKYHSLQIPFCGSLGIHIGNRGN